VAHDSWRFPGIESYASEVKPFAQTCVFLVLSMGLIGLALSMLSALPARGAPIPTAQVVGGKRSPIHRMARVHVVVAHVVGTVMIAAVVGVAIGSPPWAAAQPAVSLLVP